MLLPEKSNIIYVNDVADIDDHIAIISNNISPPVFFNVMNIDIRPGISIGSIEYPRMLMTV